MRPTRHLLLGLVAVVASAGCGAGSERPAAYGPSHLVASATAVATPDPALPDGSYYGRISPVRLTRTAFQFTIACSVRPNTRQRPRLGRKVTLRLPASVTPVIWFAPGGDYSKGHGQDADFSVWSSTVAHPDPAEGMIPSWYVGIRHGQVFWVGEEIPIGQESSPCRGNGNAP